MIRLERERAGTDIEIAEAADAAMELADDVEALQGEEAGANIFNVATGTATPLKEYIEEWFVDQAFIGKTVLQQPKAFTVLEEWCNANRKAATLAYA